MKSRNERSLVLLTLGTRSASGKLKFRIIKLQNEKDFYLFHIFSAVLN